jgi:hypothetical protein
MMDRDNIRLIILQILKSSAGYMANHMTILEALRKQGFGITRDQLVIELAWLDSTADALVDRATGGVHICTLSGTGLDVVDGLSVIPGIRRPRPDELTSG